MRALFVSGVVAIFVVLVGGCFIFTGGTDGYSQAVIDSGPDDATATCSPDATCIALGCLGSTDCDAGDVCCLTESFTGLGSACQSQCSGPQFCESNAECNGSTCISQSCSSSGVSLVIRACGSVEGCTQ